MVGAEKALQSIMKLCAYTQEGHAFLLQAYRPVSRVPACAGSGIRRCNLLLHQEKSAESEAIAAEAYVLPGQTKPELQQSRTVALAASKSEPVDYIEQLKPRIADVQASAPRYDETNKARDFPRPTCMSSTDVRMLLKAQSRGQKVGVHRGEETVCQCYTQQSTRMATSFEFCMSVVENGYFDDTKQMPAYAQSQGGLSSRKEDPADGLRRGPAAVDQKPVDSSSVKGVKFTVVEDHSRGGRNVLQ